MKIKIKFNHAYLSMMLPFGWVALICKSLKTSLHNFNFSLQLIETFHKVLLSNLILVLICFWNIFPICLLSLLYLLRDCLGAQRVSDLNTRCSSSSVVFNKKKTLPFIHICFKFSISLSFVAIHVTNVSSIMIKRF